MYAYVYVCMYVCMHMYMCVFTSAQEMLMQHTPAQITYSPSGKRVAEHSSYRY